MKYIKISNINLSTLLQVCLIVMCIFLLMRNPKQVYPVSKQKTIERRIEGKETLIREKGQVIDNSNKFIAQLNAGLLDLHSQLDAVRDSKDTFNIVQIQDTMIHVLYRRDKEKDLIIKNQDTIIQAQRYIINSKDTIITAQAFDIKKLKRQRNISVLLSALLGTGLIIK
jgi:hypothetical protein